MIVSLLFWGFFVSYLVHIIDETLMNGGFVHWVVANFRSHAFPQCFAITGLSGLSASRESGSDHRPGEPKITRPPAKRPLVQFKLKPKIAPNGFAVLVQNGTFAGHGGGI